MAGTLVRVQAGALRRRLVHPVEHHPDVVEASGSSPLSPTDFYQKSSKGGSVKSLLLERGCSEAGQLGVSAWFISTKPMVRVHLSLLRVIPIVLLPLDRWWEKTALLIPCWALYKFRG